MAPTVSASFRGRVNPLGLLPSKHLASPDVLWATFTFLVVSLEMNKEIVSNRCVGNNDVYKTLGISGSTSKDGSCTCC
jgi:hypothetical protein